jgi:hypothetical protein
VQLFPERVRTGRKLLVAALILSLLVHAAGGALWALLGRSARAAAHASETVLAQTQPITIERIVPPSPTPTPTPPPTPRPRVAQGRPHVTRRPVAQPASGARPAPLRAQPTFAPHAEPSAAPRVAHVHIPRAERVAVVRAPSGSHGAAPAGGALDVAALDGMFRKTIDQAQHDVATTPQAGPPAAVHTMKRYDKYLQGNVEDVTGGNGVCDPLDDGTQRGLYTWYYLRCTVRYADGYSETVSFPWPFKFTRQTDPFARHDGRHHEFPGQPPPDSFVLPHPFALSRAVCAFYRDECKAVIDRERANGDLPNGG